MTAFRCLIVGESSLPVACAQAVQRAGHVVAGMVSPDPPVRDWAARNDIPSAGTGELLPFAQGLAFDYLFSVVNYAILPAAVLALPRRAAINYHDALLPRYAGVYATSWVILHREPEHGITWHRMTDRVDAGDVLKQVRVPLAASETAASLNRKCYFAAVRAFSELVEELAAGRERPTPQELAGRSYFPLAKRPAGGGVIGWDADAADIDAFVRAMDFGDDRNPFAVPKIVADGRVFVALGSRVTAERSGRPPGTVTAVGPDGITVATRTQNLELRRGADGRGSGRPLGPAGGDAVGRRGAGRVGPAVFGRQPRRTVLGRTARRPPLAGRGPAGGPGPRPAAGDRMAGRWCGGRCRPGRRPPFPAGPFRGRPPSPPDGRG